MKPHYYTLTMYWDHCGVYWFMWFPKFVYVHMADDLTKAWKATVFDVIASLDDFLGEQPGY